MLNRILTLIAISFLMINNHCFSKEIDWIRDIGGSNEDIVYTLIPDSHKNVYIAGYFQSTEFKFSDNIKILNKGEADAFIAKFDSNGTCIWAQSIAGNGKDFIFEINIDSSDNIYVVGASESDVLLFNQNIKISKTKSNDSFLAKYNKDGGCQWSILIEGDASENTYGVEIDSNNDIVICGGFSSSEINFNNGVKLQSNGVDDGFLAKYSSSGICKWATKISGTGLESATRLKIDRHNNVIVIGSSTSKNLIFGNEIQIINNNNFDGFLAKYDHIGICLWAKNIKGSKEDWAFDLAIDDLQEIYLVGFFKSTLLEFGNDVTLSKQANDFFAGYLSKYDINGNCLFAKAFEGSDNNVRLNAICVTNDKLITAGSFESQNLSIDNLSLSNSGASDIFYSSLGLDGNIFNLNKIYGNKSEYPTKVRANNFKEVFLSGYFLSSNLNILDLQILNKGQNDGFLLKIGNKDNDSILQPNLLYPANLSILKSDTLTLIWSKVVNADNYVLQISMTENFDQLVLDEQIIDTIFNFKKVNNIQKYYWRVKAKNNINESDWSNIWIFDLNKFVFNAPKLIQPLNNSMIFSKSVNFMWSSNDTNINFKLIIFNESGFDSPLLQIDLNKSSFSTILEENGIYYWKVRSFNGNDSSDWSETWKFELKEKPINIPILKSPQNFSESVKVPTDLIWQSSDTNVKYQLAISEISNFSDKTLNIETTDTIFASVLKLNTDYYWRVRAKKESDSSEWSETWSFKTIVNTNIVDFGNNEIIKLLYSPINDHISFSINTIFDRIRIFDSEAKELQINNKEIVLTGNIVNINVSNLRTGSYYVLIYSGSKIYKGKFMKNNL